MPSPPSSGVVDAEKEALQPRLRDCLARLVEAEELLCNVRRAEEAVACAKRCLGELTEFRPQAKDVDFQMQDMGCSLQSSREAEEEPGESLGVIADEVLFGTGGKYRLTSDNLLLPMRAPSSPFIDVPTEAALRNPLEGTWTLADLRRGFVMVEAGFCGLRAPVFFPSGKYAMTWDLLGLFFIIFETFALPVNLSFSAEPEGFWFGVVSAVNVYFIVDIFVNFRRAYKEVGGQMVVAPGMIASRYCKWVAADVLAGIPWEWITPVMERRGARGSRWAQLTKLLRLFRIARLLRLLRIRVLPEGVKMFIEGNTLLSFVQGCLRVLFCLFSITHWAACIWFLIGSSTSEEKTWIAAHLPPSAPFSTEYMYSLYFTLTTMTTVGYGDITPQNDTEVFFTLCLLLIATVVFATLMGALTDLICSLQGESSSLDARVRSLSHYMSWRQVPPKLFRALRKHLLHVWETQRGFDSYELELKASLTPVLREELFYHAYGHMLRSATFLSWLWDYEVCLKELATSVASMTLTKGDFIFRRGQANESCHILLSGSVRVSLNDSLHNSISEEDEEEDGHPLLGVLGVFHAPKHHVRRKPSVFKSLVLMQATERLQRRDSLEHWAARYIQRMWKRRKLRQLFLAPLNQQAAAGVLHARSRSVAAPAHFGEACLWQPLEDWGRADPPLYSYSARCEARCDLATISRDEVQALLRRYSPWLRQRFEAFRKDVVEAMRSRMNRQRPAPLPQRHARRLPSREGKREPSPDTPCSRASTPKNRADAHTPRNVHKAWRHGHGGGAKWGSLRDPLLRTRTDVGK